MLRTRCWAPGFLLLLLCAGEAAAQAKVQRRVQPDLEVISATLSHDKLSPDTPVGVTVVVRANGSRVGPFSVGLDLGPSRVATMTYDKGLPAGRSVTLVTEVRVPPCDPCGPRTLNVAVDPGNLVAEAVETNNARVVAFDVSPAYLPDLVVEKVSITPDRGPIDGKVTVRGVVRNAGKFLAQGPLRVSVVCSPGPEVTPADMKLHSFRVPALGPGQATNVERSLQLGPTCGVRALSTWLGIVADDQGSVREANEQNNARSAGYWVYRAPDLGARPLDVSATSGPPGQRMLVTYRVKNQGGAAAGPFQAGVFLAKAGAGPGSGTLIDTVDVPSLAANTDSGLIEHAFVIPKDAARGKHQLSVVVDLAGTMGELRKRNNFQAAPFTVTDTNLTEVYFTAEQKEVVAGGTVNLRLRLKQTGADRAAASTVGIYYSEDPRFDPSVDVRLGVMQFGPVPPRGASPEEALTVTVPALATEGYHFILAVLDSMDDVAETDERDNVALEPVRVFVP